MNIQSLNYFLVVADELSFTKAAGKLFVSQQTLSNHIQKLETYFGTNLFLRTTPLTLTPSGHYLYREARKLIQFHDNLLQELQDIEHFDSGTLAIGSTHSRARFLLPSALRQFHQKYPQVKIELFEGTTPQVEEWLHKGDLDLTVGFIPEDVTNIHSIHLYDEQFMVLIPISLLREHFKDKTSLIIEQMDKNFNPALLKDLPFLNLSPHTKLNHIFQIYMEENKIKPNILMETPNIDTLISLCYEGLGITICPVTFLRFSYYDSQRFRLYPIKTGYARSAIVINHHADHYLPLSAQEFIRILQADLSENEPALSF